MRSPSTTTKKFSQQRLDLNGSHTVVLEPVNGRLK